MQLTRNQIGNGVTALAIGGSVHCGAECTHLESEVNALIQEKQTRLILDLSGVSSMDSAAIGALVRCLTKLNKAGGGLRMACAQPMVDYSLKLTKLDKLIPNYKSVGDAASGFSAAASPPA